MRELVIGVPSVFMPGGNLNRDGWDGQTGTCDN